MRKTFSAIVPLFLFATPAGADIILGGTNWTATGSQLQLAATVPGGNQPLNIPCVICGDHQPQQDPTIGYTNFHNTGQPNQDLRYFSTNVIGGGNPGLDTVGTGYSGELLRAFLIAQGDPNLTFSIGIDVNDTGKAQTLESFALLNLTTHTVLAQYSLFQPGGTAIPSQNNGTGFPDYTLSGFNIQLGQDISFGDQLIFYARISGANDGPDSFFLVPTVQAAVPELSTWLMMILGFAGIGTLALRRKGQLRLA